MLEKTEFEILLSLLTFLKIRIKIKIKKPFIS